MNVKNLKRGKKSFKNYKLILDELIAGQFKDEDVVFMNADQFVSK